MAIQISNTDFETSKCNFLDFYCISDWWEIITILMDNVKSKTFEARYNELRHWCQFTNNVMVTCSPIWLYLFVFRSSSSLFLTLGGSQAERESVALLHDPALTSNDPKAANQALHSHMSTTWPLISWGLLGNWLPGCKGDGKLEKSLQKPCKFNFWNLLFIIGIGNIILILMTLGSI